MSIKFFHKIFLLFYLLINSIAVIYILKLDELIGDFHGFKFNIEVLLSSLFLIFVIYYSLSNYVDNHFKLANKFDSNIIGNNLSLLILCIQIFYIFYVIKSETRVAGSLNIDSSILSIIFSIFEPDLLFLIVYALFRDSKFIYSNILMNVVSSFIRGWSGVFFTIFFFEIYRQLTFSKSKFLFFKICILLIVFLCAFPYIYIFKLFIREALSTGFNYDSLLDVIVKTIHGFDGLDFFEILNDHLFFPAVARLQMISSAVGVYDLVEYLRMSIEGGASFPYWLEGLHGISYNRLFTSGSQDPISLVLGELITNNDPAMKGWYPNPTLLGWLFISSYFSFLTIAYVFLIVYISIWLVKKISYTQQSQNLIWFCVMSFIVPGWFMVYSKFISALFFILFLKILINSIENFNKSSFSS